MEHVSPEDLKALPNLPGYAFRQPLERSFEAVEVSKQASDDVEYL